MSPFAMTVLLLVGLGVFAWTARRRWKLMRSARAADLRFDRPAQRWRGVLLYMFGQLRMFRYKGAGVAHAFIFAGFVVLALRTLILFARGYTGGGFGFWIFDDWTPLGVVYTFLKDVVGILVIVGVAWFLYQRLVVRPGRMELSTEGIAILCVILGIVASDMAYEAGAFVREDVATGYRFVAPGAAVLSFGLGAADAAVAENFFGLGFWLHSILVLAFLNFLPYGKHFHVLTVLPNVYFRNLENIGRLKPAEDIEGRLEREETLGARTSRDFSWKDVLDFYTCTECGRCSDFCPATNTGKLLSPKHLTMNLRDHMYARQDELTGTGRGASSPTDSNGNGNGESPAGDADGPLVPLTVNPEVIWACTTCGACEQECPVFISYVDKIVELRRNAVMEQGEFPTQLQNAFRGLETVGNPYSADNATRGDWAEGLDIPLLSDRPDAEYLYWVGCAPSFDDRSRRIARAFAQLMLEAGVDFAILGPEETCTGDPARRAGNEYLFQMFAQQNVETLDGYKVRKIVTTCPHCFNIYKNEYPAFGGHYEVVHHTDLLARLLREGRLEPRHDVAGTVVFHDSCYLGRYNDVYDPPRDILRAIPGLRVVEAPESRDRGMCCGAGGAQMWKEEEPTSDEKVNHARTRQLLRVLPHNGAGNRVATACPFCKTMLSDGLTDKSREDVAQADVAEYLLESIQGGTSTRGSTEGETAS